MEEAREAAAAEVAELLQEREFEGITVEECEAEIDCSGERQNIFR